MLVLSSFNTRIYSVKNASIMIFRLDGLPFVCYYVQKCWSEMEYKKQTFHILHISRYAVYVYFCHCFFSVVFVLFSKYNSRTKYIYYIYEIWFAWRFVEFVVTV